MPAGRRTIRWTEHAVRELAGDAEYLSDSSPVYAEQTVALIESRLAQAARFLESGGPILSSRIPRSAS
jgi:plasmid stabilization system protein ParE